MIITKAAVEDEAGTYLTPRGVRLWWNREAWQLDGKSPRQVWEEGDRERVLDFARAGRGMIAT